jgi:SAM-dependent methyltransferase
MVGVSDVVIWHDVECGGYGADLPLWRRLALEAGGAVLDLGAGTGRVALDLAEAGHAVTAVDSNPLLLDELARRAEARGLAVDCIQADVRELAGTGSFGLIIAPMQLLQVLGGAAARTKMLAGVLSCLTPDGTFAAAIANLDDAVAAESTGPPVPDVRERRGWIYSSLPLDVRPEPSGVAIEWLRQTVSPAGTLTEERHTEILDSLHPDQLEREAASQGLRPEARHEVSQTPVYVGSTVVVCRR